MNKIKDLEVLVSLVNLEVLDISDNCIKEIPR